MEDDELDRYDAAISGFLEQQAAVWAELRRQLEDRPGWRFDFDRERRFLDIGSGGGFPGLVIAAAINAQMTLVEARRKRATYLNEAVVEMGLRNVQVECARAESIDVREGFDLVTARAVGNPRSIFEIAGRALRPGGVLMLYVSADQEFDDDAGAGAGAAKASGLLDGSVIGYDLRHGRKVMRRAVATWPRA